MMTTTERVVAAKDCKHRDIPMYWWTVYDLRFDLAGDDGLLCGMNMLDLCFFSRHLVNTLARTELPARSSHLVIFTHYGYPS